jgi:phage recombination protein Bet
MIQQTKEAATNRVAPPGEQNSRHRNHPSVSAALDQSNRLKPAGAPVNKVSSLTIQSESHLPSQHFNHEQVDILKNSICKGATDEEFKIFLMACQKTQLDPFMRQIYAVKRWDNRLKRETMTIQTGIDGYRLIAERTEKYAPGPKPTFEYDVNGNLVAATAYVKKMTMDGTWHVVEAEAYLDEYCQTITDKTTGEKKAIGMWSNMQRNQLAKCAESLALRKAFPAEMSGVYTKEEMKQADFQDLPKRITQEQADDLEMILADCEEKYRNWVYEHLNKQYKVVFLTDVPLEIYPRMREAAMRNMEAHYSKQKQVTQVESEPQLVSLEVS